MIQHIDYFIPEERIAIGQVLEETAAAGQLAPYFASPQDGASFFAETLGLNAVAYAGNVTEEEMLVGLLQRFEAAPKDKIDLLLSIGDNPDKKKSTLHYLQHALGFSKANVLQLSGNHCANTEFAILFAESLLKAGAAHHILLVDAARYQNHAQRMVGNYGIYGDGAGLMYLSGSGEIEIAGHHSYTNGSLYNADTATGNTLQLYTNYMKCLLGFKQKYPIHPRTILVPNANYALTENCLGNIGFDQPPLYMENIGRYGYLGSIDLFLNLHTANKQLLQPGDELFSFGTGWAGSYCCLYMKKNQP